MEKSVPQTRRYIWNPSPIQSKPSYLPLTSVFFIYSKQLLFFFFYHLHPICLILSLCRLGPMLSHLAVHDSHPLNNSLNPRLQNLPAPKFNTALSACLYQKRIFDWSFSCGWNKFRLWGWGNDYPQKVLRIRKKQFSEGVLRISMVFYFSWASTCSI